MMQHGFLVLADISGFTSYVAQTELEHADDILSELLKLLVSRLTPTLTLVEVEGDAVYVSAPEARLPNGETLLELYESTYTAFKDRVESVIIPGGVTETDAVFIAAGLRPNAEMLEGVKKGPFGEVVVDNRMRTSVKDVYACGDVVGPPYLTPVARHQGIVAADNILGIPRTMDYKNIPRSISLTHELAYCINKSDGMGSLAIPGPAGPGSFWSVPTGQTGLAKVIFEPESGELAGICAAGPGGGLVAGYMAFLMKKHFSVHDFEEFIEVHPSTDGVYGLAKYASAVLKKRNRP